MKFTISAYITDSEGLGIKFSKGGVEDLAYEIEKELEGLALVSHGVNVVLFGVEVEPHYEGT